MKTLAILVFSVTTWGAPRLEMKAGVARVDITPSGPSWLSGYAARTKPSEGVKDRLAAKALALEDRTGNRAVIVTTDLIGLSRQITDFVAAEVLKQYKLDRERLVFNSSHTHSGPVVWRNLSPMFNFTPEQEKEVLAYRDRLQRELVTVIGAALGDLQPARVDFGQGETKFAANRRELTPTGVKLGVHPAGPVDHSVPVLRVTDGAGKVRAVLFGYACHNTTLTGEFYYISGDYAGAAQAEVERELAGSTALFMELCGGDQNPNPRSKVELVEQHGKTLGAEAARVARGTMKPVTGRVRAAYQNITLPLAPHTRGQFEEELKDSNVFKVRRARNMLRLYDERAAPRTVTYPIQALRFERGFTLIALGGEVVVDYALWAKREFAGEPLVVAGYSNDVMCYIPTARILKEGGYEAVDSMIYYGQPGPFSEEVEPRLQEALRGLLKRVKK